MLLRESSSCNVEQWLIGKTEQAYHRHSYGDLLIWTKKWLRRQGVRLICLVCRAEFLS